ncbi:glutathione S-transferase N-terminal domain-containing protein [Patescibacteria group bacterium]
MRNIILITILVFMLSCGVVSAEMMLFVGDGCPHCAVVEKDLTEKDYFEKFDITTYEIWHNQENKQIYLDKKVEIGYDGGGVPLLVDQDEYKVGSSPIIKYLDGLDENEKVEIAASEIEVVENEFISETRTDDEAESEADVDSLSEDESEDLNGIIKEIKDEDKLEDQEETKDQDEEEGGLSDRTIKIITIIVIIGGVSMYFGVLNKVRKSKKN